MSQTIDQNILKVAQEWTSSFVRKAVSRAEKAKLFNSKELLNSFAADLAKSTAADAIYIAMSFHDYGRIQDMKSVNYSRLLPQTRLKEWVLRKGVEKFKPTKGRTYKGSDVNRLANQIAWGISVKRMKGDKPPRRRRWYNKGKTAEIYQLQIDLMAAMADGALADLSKSFNQ